MNKISTRSCSAKVHTHEICSCYTFWKRKLKKLTQISNTTKRSSNFPVQFFFSRHIVHMT